MSRELANLREDFNRMFKMFDIRLSRVERTLDKLTLDVKDEAKSVLKCKLKEVGIEIEVSSLSLPEFGLNLYGVLMNIA